MYINQNTNFEPSHNTSPRTVPIQYIVIHYVGATGDAKANIDYYNERTTTQASADFYVGFAGDVWQYNMNPNGRYCWAVGGDQRANGFGGGKYYGVANNGNCVSIELCVRNKGNRTPGSPDWYFEDATINSAVSLVKHLMNVYNVPINRVIRHFDVNGKFCPGVVGWNPMTGSEDKWQEFLRKVSGANNDTVTTNSGYQMWVGHVINCENDTLNVRTGAGTSNPLLSSYPHLGQGNQVEVIDEQYASDGFMWYKIRIAGKHIGFINAAYLFPDKGTFVGEVHSAFPYLNVRIAPNAGASIYKPYPMLGNTNRIDVLGTVGEWYRVRIGTKHIAYVHRAYVKKVG